jgi:3-oxoadipate enol-lactonase
MTHLQIARARTVLHADLHGSGDGPMVVFTHGGWMDRRMFDEQIGPMTAAGYRVLTWDLRGHGQSLPRGSSRPSVADMADDLVAVLDEVESPGAVSLVGQSLGGMVSQYVALVAPQRVASLVTIGAPCINPDDPTLTKRMATVWRVSGLISGLLPHSVLLRGMAKGTAVTPAAQDYVRTVTSGSTRESVRWLTQAAAQAGRDLPSRGIEVPVLITRGEHDRSGAGRLTAMTAQSWVARDPRARYVEIPEAGHQAHQDQPEAFNVLLLDFLESANERS